MNSVIYYHPEAYTTSGPKLMGRNAAGESFLRGFFAYSKASELWVQVEHADHGATFAQAAVSYGRSEKVNVVSNNNLGDLSQAGTVYLPGPGLGQYAFQRAAFGHAEWSLCGITHTTSSALSMDAIANLITAPIQPWDAMICTSSPVKDNVTRVLQAQVEYLEERLGVSKTVLPELPIIPLGIHTQDFSFAESLKAKSRKTLEIPPAAMVVLFLGRLSFHAKAHPLAMYQALEASAQATQKKVVLIECGWHANELIKKDYVDAASLACPSVRVITLNGRDASAREMAWSSADVFCSLSDNIQETFGISPLEAMATGLPVVVSDWDGYKDTVRDGVDGFRIPTIMPSGGLGGDIATNHALAIDSYDKYCGYVCSFIAVEIEAATNAFVQLFESAELRHKMGESGRKRVQAIYDWSVIIPQYESLWEHLAELRGAKNKQLQPSIAKWPARLDPFHSFGTYPTRALTEQTKISLVESDVSTALKRIRDFRKLGMVRFANMLLPSEAEIETVLLAALQAPNDAITLVKDIDDERKAIVFRGLVWLIKLGVLRAESL